jgi:hypothetical protein
MAISPALDHSQKGLVLRGERTVTLDQFALWDRIINIKFIRARGGENNTPSFFVLRSDFEAIYTENGKGIPQIIPIKIKPSITVKYKQASNTTITEIEVRIANLYFANQKAGDSIFAQRENPITQMEIFMGYRHQFPDWTTNRALREGPENLKKFFNMDAFAITNVPEVLDTGMKLTVNVLAAYTEGLPPDQITFFQCAYGTLQYGLRFTDPGTLKEYFEVASNFPQDRREPYTTLEKIFFLYVTSRFFANGFPYQLYDNQYDEDFDAEEDDVEQWVKVKGYNTGTHTFFSADSDDYQNWFDVDFTNGIMNPDDAAALGVRVFVTRKLRDMSRANTIARPNPTQPYIARLQELDEKIPSIGFQDKLGAQLIKIQEMYPSIRWYQRVDGSFLVYDVSESIAEMTEDEYFAQVMRQTRPIILPAVYDITVQGTRYVRCPFVTFISPTQLICFRAKYNIGSLVQFFYPHPKDAWFRAIISEVEFSTDGEENSMNIMCIDVPAATAEAQLALVGSATATIEESASAIQRGNETVTRALDWVTITIVEAFRGERETETVITSWELLAKNYVLNNADFLDLEILDHDASLKDAMQYLLDQNSGNAIDWQSRGMGAEGRRWYGILDPWPPQLRVGDTIEVPSAEVTIE